VADASPRALHWARAAKRVGVPATAMELWLVVSTLLFVFLFTAAVWALLWYGPFRKLVRPFYQQLKDDLELIAKTMALDTLRRKHDVITPEHLLRAVLAIPEIEDTLAPRCQLGSLSAALEARLAERAVHPEPVAPSVSAEVQALTRAAYVAATWRFPASHGHDMARAILRRLIEEETGPTHELLAQHGLRPGVSVLPDKPASGSRTPSVSPVTRSGDRASTAGPYREAQSASRQARVVFWNDDRTKMEQVVEILGTVFSIDPTRALYLMLAVHTRGRADVWRGAQDEADVLARHATNLARSRGAPLRVTVEPSAHQAVVTRLPFGSKLYS
jgi:ATP-dependent Clp protease adaptor protein ClpS